MRQRSTYFTEAVTTRAAHLRGWGGLHSDTSLYCHQSQSPDNRCKPYQLFSHQLQCYLVPPLDEWFGFTKPGLHAPPNCTAPLIDADTAVKHHASFLYEGRELENHTQGATGAREKLRLRYWAVHLPLRKHVTCGFDDDSALKISLHVRLGDLIRPSAANLSEITDHQKHMRDHYFANRATELVRDVCCALLLLDDVAVALGPGLRLDGFRCSLSATRHLKSWFQRLKRAAPRCGSTASVLILTVSRCTWSRGSRCAAAEKNGWAKWTFYKEGTRSSRSTASPPRMSCLSRARPTSPDSRPSSAGGGS